MKIAVLLNTTFKSTLAKLMDAKLPLKVAYKLHSIDKVIKEEGQKYDKLRMQALDQFGKRKEDGSYDVDENGNVRFEDAKATEFADQMTELLNVEFEHVKLTLEELEGKVELTANELLALEPILDLK